MCVQPNATGPNRLGNRVLCTFSRSGLGQGRHLLYCLVVFAKSKIARNPRPASDKCHTGGLLRCHVLICLIHSDPHKHPRSYRNTQTYLRLAAWESARASAALNTTLY